MNRYAFTNPLAGIQLLAANPNGNWVRWSDAEAELDRLTAQVVPWKKATPGQIMGDGDEILLTGSHPTTGTRWYAVVTVRCDEDSFELVQYGDDEPSEISWGDIDYWCYTNTLGPAAERREGE